MTVALVQSSTSGSADNQQAFCTVPVPAGAAAGHVAVLAIEIWLDTATDPTLSWPAGFTQIGYVEDTVNGYQRLYIARKVLSAGDTGNYQPTWTGNYWTQGQCTLWSGVDNTTPLDTAVVTATTVANTTMPSLNLTTVTAGCGMVHLVANENTSTGTPPTGYTERQDANYLRSNTKVAGAAGSEAPSGGTISVSTVKLGALVALRAAGGGSDIGTALETDAAQPVGRIRATTAGVAAETDTAQPVGRTRTTTAGVAAEAEQAQAVSSIRATTAGVAAETDAAQPVGRTRTTTLGTALEGELALGPGGGGGTPAGAAAETDAGQPVGRIRTTTVGTATETDTAQAVSRTRTTTLGAAAELEAAQPIGTTRTTLLGAALETDAGQPVTGPNPPASDLLLTGRVESPWQTRVEAGRYLVEVEA